jgi:hypothetical protein
MGTNDVPIDIAWDNSGPLEPCGQPVTARYGFTVLPAAQLHPSPEPLAKGVSHRSIRVEAKGFPQSASELVVYEVRVEVLKP